MAPSAPKPVLFISRSSAGPSAAARTVAIRDALAQILDARGWNVFLDREVFQPGDRWRTNIVYNLARANGAVILFDERAVTQSKWVVAGSLILCFHKSVGPRFQLIPVLLEDKTLQDTSFAKYRPFELNQIQAFPDDANLSPADVAARIADRFEIGLAQTEPSRGCTRVRSVLWNIKDRTTLQRAARF